MALKKACHKLQSSLANFIFVNFDLPQVWKEQDWQIFKRTPWSIVRDEKDHRERLIAIQLSVLAHHIEIMKQCLYEQIEQPAFKDNKDLEALDYFLRDLRNSFAHTTGKLIPQYSNEKPLWTKKKLNKNSFEVNMPVEKIKNSIQFALNSNFSIKFIWKKIKPNKEIKVNDRFILSILILSYHVLEITKKQKRHTLDAYLKKIPKATKNFVLK